MSTEQKEQLIPQPKWDKLNEVIDEITTVENWENEFVEIIDELMSSLGTKNLLKVQEFVKEALEAI
jgi:hypothetical protein